jgi:2-haloacid dehalogenase
VNRAGDPMERLGHPPHEMLTDLTPIPDIAKGI